MPAHARQKGKHGYWYVEIPLGRGKRQWQKVADEATARYVASEWNRRHAKPERAGVHGSPAFDAVVQRWWEKKSGGWRETSQRTRKNIVRRLRELLGSRDIRELDEDEVGLLAQRLCPPNTTYAVPTVAETMNLLSEIVTWSVGKVIREHPCNSDPKKTIRAIGLRIANAKCRPPDTRDAWTYDEAQIILARLRDRGAWIYDPFYFCLRTGTRLGEMVALQWPDVDLERRCFTIRQSRSYRETTATKASRIRTRPLADDILAHLREMHGRRLDDGYVFRNSRRGQINADSFSGVWPKVVRTIQAVRPLEFHCTRHTWASWAVDQGWTPAQAAWYIGDTEEVFRKHYSHILKDKHFDLNFFQPSPAAAPSPQPEKAARPRPRLVR